MKVRQASAGGTNIQAGGSVRIGGGHATGTVINDGEVWINGEKCYPQGQIKALAMAYDLLVVAAVAVAQQVGDPDAEHRYQRCADRVQRNLEALDLA